jgi:hypothetical protein
MNGYPYFCKQTNVFIRPNGILHYTHHAQLRVSMLKEILLKQLIQICLGPTERFSNALATDRMRKHLLCNNDRSYLVPHASHRDTAASETYCPRCSETHDAV